MLVETAWLPASMSSFKNTSNGLFSIASAPSTSVVPGPLVAKVLSACPFVSAPLHLDPNGPLPVFIEGSSVVLKSDEG